MKSLHHLLYMLVASIAVPIGNVPASSEQVQEATVGQNKPIVAEMEGNSFWDKLSARKPAAELTMADEQRTVNQPVGEQDIEKLRDQLQAEEPDNDEADLTENDKKEEDNVLEMLKQFKDMPLEKAPHD